jgi:hypothetical protein
MARTFTISFMHQNKECLAVVSQLHETVCIYLPDPCFHEIIPNGRFTYDPKIGLKTDTHCNGSVKTLIQEILQEIESQTQNHYSTKHS